MRWSVWDHVTFGQKIGLFVLVAQEASRRCVSFEEYNVSNEESDVSNDAEPGGAPRGDEQVGLVPAREAHAKRTVFQKPVPLPKAGRSQRPLSSLVTVRPSRER